MKLSFPNQTTSITMNQYFSSNSIEPILLVMLSILNNFIPLVIWLQKSCYRINFIGSRFVVLDFNQFILYHLPKVQYTKFHKHRIEVFHTYDVHTVLFSEIFKLLISGWRIKTSPYIFFSPFLLFFSLLISFFTFKSIHFRFGTNLSLIICEDVCFSILTVYLYLFFDFLITLSSFDIYILWFFTSFVMHIFSS